MANHFEQIQNLSNPLSDVPPDELPSLVQSVPRSQASVGTTANGLARAIPVEVENPTPTRQLARTIHGVHTEVLAQRFHDRILVVVTQLETMGCMLQVTMPMSTSSLSELFPPQRSGLPQPHPSAIITPLLFTAPSEYMQTLIELYANQIAAIVLSRSGVRSEDLRDKVDGDWEGQSVVVGVGLKRRVNGAERGEVEEDLDEVDRQTFAEAMEMVLNCRVW